MANAPKLDHPPTMADLEALPENVRGEILDGVMYTQPRPRARHQRVLGTILDGVYGPYDRGRAGPGGWWILPEPGITLQGSAEISPDLAGWRRERLPEIPDGTITLVPDWVCEILSTNRNYDLRIKRPFYARIGVRWLWYVDLDAKTLTVSELSDGRWLELGIHSDDDRVRCKPFDEVELPLGEWW